MHEYLWPRRRGPRRIHDFCAHLRRQGMLHRHCSSQLETSIQKQTRSMQHVGVRLRILFPRVCRMGRILVPSMDRMRACITKEAMNLLMALTQVAYRTIWMSARSAASDSRRKTYPDATTLSTISVRA